MIYIVITLAVCVFYKLLLFLLLYPQMALDAYRRKHYERWGKSLIIKCLTVFYVEVEKHMTKGGLKRYFIYNIGLIPSHHIRKWMYRGLGADVGRNVVFHFRTEMRALERITVGDGTIVGDNAVLDGRGRLTIGKNVNISSNVSIWSAQHDYRDPDFNCSATRRMEVNIDDRVWLGCNVIVLPGVHIGEGAVCCAGCVVTKDVEPYSVVAGVPAKKVAERPRVLRYNFSGDSCRLY